MVIMEIFARSLFEIIFASKKFIHCSSRDNIKKASYFGTFIYE